MSVPASTSPARISGAAALLALAVILAWGNSLDGPFVLDDIQNISSNETLRDFRHAFFPPQDSSVGGRPILNFTFALNHAISGTSVRSYHVVNLAIHILATLTLFGLVRRTIDRGLSPTPTTPNRASGVKPDLPLVLAFAAALLWALHPLQTATVTYVSQRAESLMGLCYFLVLYCTARSAAPGAAGLWPFAAIAACLVGVGTKEVIVTVPLVALLYDRTFLAGSFRDAWRRRRWLYIGLAASCCGLFWLMRGIEARGVAAAGTTPWQYLLVQCRVLVSYFKLALWPHPLVFDYGQFADAPLRSALGALFLASLLVGTIAALVRRPALGFVGAFFFLVLAPTSSVVPVTFQPMGEHRLYVPLAALISAAVVAAAILHPRRFVAPFLVAAAASLTLTIARNADYHDPVRLWAGTLAQRPDNYRAQNEYALSLAQAGRTDEAIASMRRALARNPAASTLHRNLALLLMQEGRTAEALPHFAQLVQLEPAFVNGRREYARALAAAGRLTDAIEQVRAGADLLPLAAGPRLELGQLLAQTDRPAEALAEFEAAVRLEPNNAQARNELGSALLAAGRGSAALDQFAAGLRLAPDQPMLHANYGHALLSAGRTTEALPHLAAWTRLDPGSPEAHCLLADALAEAGRPGEAIPHYEEALRLRPDFAPARANLQRLRRQFSK